MTKQQQQTKAEKEPKYEGSGDIAMPYKVVRKASCIKWPESSKEDSRYLESTS